MSTTAEKTSGFVGEVRKISITSIRPSPHNPRGEIEKNENYQRLVASIDKNNVLVPIVVRELANPKGEVEFELVDGERRYWAARECNKEVVPAHVLSATNSLGNLRKLMFHLHMTRDEWGAIAQCKALSEAYPELKEGLRFSEKADWVKKLCKEIVMGTALARDRVSVLSWPRNLKERFYAFDAGSHSKDVYSYILAIEVSVVEPSVSAFPDYYNHGNQLEHVANKVRNSLLDKTINGIETGMVTSREQIRTVAPLFSADLDGAKKKIALNMFRGFIDRPEQQFDDLRAEVVAKLPEALKEKPPKPQRIISMIQTLDRMLRDYDPSYLDESSTYEVKRINLRMEFLHSLEGLAAAIKELKGKF